MLSLHLNDVINGKSFKLNLLLTMNINMTEWMRSVVEADRVAAVPIMTHPGIEIIGRRVIDAVSDGRVHADAVCALADKYPTAAATVIMDLTVEAEAFGADIVKEPDEVPAVRGHLLDGPADIHDLKVPSLRQGRVPEYIKANMLAARRITDRPVLAGCIGPFSLAGRLYDMSGIMMLIIENPDAAAELLDKCTDFILKYCIALKEAGANGVVMAEPAAGLLSDDDCRRFSSVYVRRVVEAVQDEGFALVLHNCGNTGQCTHAMTATGAAAYHFGNRCDMARVTADVPPAALSMGNLDPVSVFKEATPDGVRRATRELLGRMESYRNFVISSGCDTPPHTPMANIDAFFDEVEAWNSGRR